MILSVVTLQPLCLCSGRVACFVLARPGTRPSARKEDMLLEIVGALVSKSHHECKWKFYGLLYTVANLWIGVHGK